MTSLWLRLELLDDVAVSQSSATVGGHRSLDFLPGAALLGAVARRTYKALDEVTAFRLFHSGKLRFGPGLPEAADRGCTVPSPLSLHERKDGGDGELLNLAVSERPAGLQYRQVRNGFRDGELGAVMVGRRGSMRTSVTREGRAREGFLFTVNAISRGAVFLSRVDADDAQDLACVAALDGQVIRLGKSRSAEFGGVRVQVLTQPPPEGAWQCEEGRVSTLRILAVSDVALRSEVGAPTFEPTPAHLGLPGSWRWDVALSFLRTRSWSPFNAYRGRPDLERQVLSAGSVLVFTGDEAVDLSDIRARLAPGVGEGRAEGLGQVLVNPVILSNARRTPAQVDNAEAARHAPAPTGELARWVGQQHQQREAVDAAWFAAMELARLYGRSRARMPKSQWGALRYFARTASGPDFVAALTDFLVEAQDGTQRAGRSVRKGEKRWGQPVLIEGQRQRLGEWLVRAVQRAAGGADVRLVTELLAVHAPRVQAATQREVQR